ncbi:hypothetical protein SLS58_002911 [Diplodia intermedia]|uniref:Uncharacterized protein n=1 Tax=Diplodia intermedia TaxID=856260 RepID=A0ABR3TXY3_9PEZI
MPDRRPILQSLPAAVSKFHPSSATPRFGSNTLAKPFVGGRCLVFQLVFADGRKWAASTPVFLPVKTAGGVMAEENQMLREVEASGYPWSPRLVGEDLGFENPVGFPFTVYEWIPGERLNWNEKFPADREARDKVMNSVVNRPIIDGSFAAREPFELAARLPRIFKDDVMRNSNVGRQDWASFLKALWGECDAATQEVVVNMSLMYVKPDRSYKQHLLETIASEGAFQVLAETFPKEVAKDVDLEMQQFLNGKVGSANQLTVEDLKKFL